MENKDIKVAFAHNVYDRFKTLASTIHIERQYFPDCQQSITCNSRVNKKFFEGYENLEVKYFTETPQHKIGCTNGMLLACNMALEHDFDVLVFSHDDVVINPEFYDVVEKHINSVFTNEYDVVCRNPSWLGTDILMMEVVFMNRKAVERLFSEIKLLKNDDEIGYYKYDKGKIHVNSISPEHWFFKKLTETDLNINVINFGLDKPDVEEISRDMGYFHLNNGKRGWKD